MTQWPIIQFFTPYDSPWQGTKYTQHTLYVQHSAICHYSPLSTWDVLLIWNHVGDMVLNFIIRDVVI